jgi:hypothetical protein
MRTELKMTPLEYLATPADLYYELTSAKQAWQEGIAEERSAQAGPHVPPGQGSR